MQQLIKTRDGTYTLLHPLKGHYHSLAGAKQEALLKFVKPALTNEMLQKNKLRILDFCFGLGYKSACLIDELPGKELVIYGLEIDEAVLNYTRELPSPFMNYSLVKRLLKENPVLQNKIKIKLLFGDAREKIKEIPEKIDICFYDPFSPTVEPDLWTEDCFRLVYTVLDSGGILTTYSCAKKIRENLKNAGFMVRDGATFGRRGPSTVGYKH